MAVLPFVQRQAIRRMRSGEAGPWGAVAAVAIGLRVMQRFGTRKDEVVYREVLKPGHEVRITHTTDSRLAVARADQRAEKAGRKAARAQKRTARAERQAAKDARRASRAAARAS